MAMLTYLILAIATGVAPEAHTGDHPAKLSAHHQQQMRLEVNAEAKTHPIRSKHSAVDDVGYDGPAEMEAPVEMEIVEFKEPVSPSGADEGGALANLFPDIAAIARGLGMKPALGDHEFQQASGLHHKRTHAANTDPATSSGANAGATTDIDGTGGAVNSAPSTGTVDDGNDAGVGTLRFGIVRLQAVVQMKNLMKPYSPSEGEESYVGSGFIIDIDDVNGPLIVSNAHVVSDAKSVCIQLPANGQECYASTVVLINHDWDLSLVQLQAAALPQLITDMGNNTLVALTLASTELDGAALAASNVVAIGFPLGKDSLAVTRGTISGTEVIGDNVQIQQDAPISPGNSGGPLVALPSLKVVGVNFASAVAQGSQNNNFAIPAFRVRAMQAEFNANSDSYTKEKCTEDIQQCSMEVSPVGASVVKGNSVLYEYYGCDSGAMVSKVVPRGIFAHANPPVEEGSFLLKVDNITLDRFGMGENLKYIQDKVMYNDLLAMNKLGDSTLTTCKCGQTQTHQVSTRWQPVYAGPVLLDDQPNLMKRDFVKFANITFQPLTKSMANKLILSSGEMSLIPYIMDENDKGVIIITETSGGDLIAGAKKALSVGTVVSEINGKKVNNMVDVRAAFPAECDGAGAGMCPAPSTSLTTSADGTTAATDSKGGHAAVDTQHPNRESWLQKGETACKKVWTMKTHDGKFIAADYDAELKRMTEGDNIFAISDTVKTAIEAAGITMPDIDRSLQPPEPEEVNPLEGLMGGMMGAGDGSGSDGGATGFMEKQTRELLPIEFRPIYRGGMTISKALNLAANGPSYDFADEVPSVPSSFVQIGPGGMSPESLMEESLMQIGHKTTKPSSFIQMGPGTLTPESLMQLKRVHASSFAEIEMGPGGMKPDSLLQLDPPTMDPPSEGGMMPDSLLQIDPPTMEPPSASE